MEGSLASVGRRYPNQRRGDIDEKKTVLFLALCKMAARKKSKSFWQRNQNRGPGRKPTVSNLALDLINQ